MKLELLFLGKTKEDYLARGIADFSRRLAHYTPVEIISLKVRKQTGKSDEMIRSYESALLDERIDSGAYRVALDSSGRQLESEELSRLLDDLEQRGIKKISFVLGGPLGLAEEQRRQADLVLSLSRMTFTHDMARLLLVEQLYRAYTIKAGEKYHK